MITGKLDVSQVAATLPDIDPLRLEDGADTSLDTGNNAVQNEPDDSPEGEVAY